jgi:hypothetical protein
LREYKDLFPKRFSELKGIKGDLGEMKIELKPYAKPAKHGLHRVKDKVKKEIDRILATRLIFLVGEFECISPIVIQGKKGTNDIRLCVDYRSLNSACAHDPFPTRFSDEVLDQMVGNEAYSFTNGFSGYH